MGDWGYDFLDSDPALDVVGLWEDNVSRASLAEDARDVEERCFRRWGDDIRFGDHTTNCQVLALAVLFLNNSQHLSGRLKKAAQDAINRELEETELQTWSEPGRRKDALLQLLKDIGGKRQKPRKPKAYSDAVLQFKSTAKAKAALMNIVKQAGGSPWENYMVYQMAALNTKQHEDPAPLPKFMWTLERMMKSGIGQKSYDIYIQGRIERLMVLATLLGISLEMTEDEISAMLDRCQIIRK